jgi:hypothetical protein
MREPDCVRDADEAVDGGCTMGSTFDIFKATVNGPLWVEAVQGLREAKERMVRLALTSPGEYFIHSQENGIVARQAEERADVL